MGRWGSGKRCVRCSRRPVSSGAGSISKPMSLPLCRSQHIPVRSRRSRTYTTPRTSNKAQIAIKAFEVDYGAKYPKALAKIVDDAEVLLEFYKYPAEHWIHLRTTNPIKSTFATVRLRTKVTKGPGSRAAGIAMAYKLIDAAQAGGGQSMHRTWSPWSVPARCSTKANCSNAPSTSHPPNPLNQAKQRSPETPPSTGLDHSLSANNATKRATSLGSLTNGRGWPHTGRS
jgi:hypothetical protein